MCHSVLAVMLREESQSAFHILKLKVRFETFSVISKVKVLGLKI